MAITKKELGKFQDVFAGLNEIRYYESNFTPGADGVITIGDVYYEMPCTVDTFKFSQAEPTINHYKVVGLSTDWASASQAGETSLSLNIPSFDKDLLALFWGSENVKTVSATIGGAMTGTSVALKKHKVTGAFVLINETADAVLILNGASLYAVATQGDSDTAPWYINLSGSIEGAADNIIFLKKGTDE